MSNGDISIGEAFNRMCDEISNAWLEFVDGMHDECDSEINSSGPQTYLAKAVQKMLPDKLSAEELKSSRARIERYAVSDNPDDEDEIIGDTDGDENEGAEIALLNKTADH